MPYFLQFSPQTSFQCPSSLASETTSTGIYTCLIYISQPNHVSIEIDDNNVLLAKQYLPFLVNADKKATEKKSGVQIGLLLKIDFVISFFLLMELKYFNLSLEKRQLADSVIFLYPPYEKKRKYLSPILSGIIKIIIPMIKIAKKLKLSIIRLNDHTTRQHTQPAL